MEWESKMNEVKKTDFLRLRLDKDLIKIHDHAQTSRNHPEDLEYLKIFCMLGIIQELREIQRVSIDQSGI